MIGKTNAVSGKPTQTKTVEFNPGSANNITIIPDDGYLLSSVEVGKPLTMIPENIKKDVNIGGVIGTHEGGITIQPVTNLTLSDEGVLSWNSPDISELTSKGYTVALSYDVYVNDVLKASVTITSVNLIAYLVEGENKIMVIAKADVKYFESETEIVETWTAPSDPIAVTLSVTLPQANYGSSAVVINNKAYIFGGYGSSRVNTILEFDPTTNTVTTLSAKLPTEMYYTSAVAINDKAYIFGGYGSSRLNTILEFDLTTNTVTTLSSTLPTEMYYTSAVVINNKAYIFGGSGSSILDTILEFDPTTNIVTTLSSTLPTPNYGSSVVEINGKAYIFFGAKSNTILEFDLTTNTVTTLSSKLISNFTYTSAVAINNKAYIFGGFYSSNTSANNTIYKYDPMVDKLTELSLKLTERLSEASSVLINGKAYIFGGSSYIYHNSNLKTIIRVDNLGQ